MHSFMSSSSSGLAPPMPAFRISTCSRWATLIFSSSVRYSASSALCVSQGDFVFSTLPSLSVSRREAGSCLGGGKLIPYYTLCPCYRCDLSNVVLAVLRVARRVSRGSAGGNELQKHGQQRVAGFAITFPVWRTQPWLVDSRAWQVQMKISSLPCIRLELEQL